MPEPTVPAGPDGRTARPSRLYALDVLRGVAALGVVFWHWQHFFYDGLAPGIPETVAWSALPLYTPFAPLYHLGWRAVDLFFCLSGFIFYWLYAGPVADRLVSARGFGALRLSRLYPLHLATFLAVIGLQAVLIQLRGTAFVYPENDLYHAVLQLLFASAWGLEQGYSFNGPVWSVSVEVLLYGLFFAACRLGWRRPWQLALASVLGLVLIETGMTPVGRGLLSFFIGGLAYYAYDRLERRPAMGTRQIGGLAAVAAVLWIAIPLNAVTDLLPDAIARAYGPGLAHVLSERASLYVFEVVLYPLTIVTLALIETRRGTWGARWAWLGDISYSSYLLHFPLQLLALAVVFGLGYDARVFLHPATLGLFFAVLIPASYATYRVFERPAMRALRRRWVSPRALRPPHPYP